MIMNNSFSKIIKAGDRQHEFNFRQLSGAEDKFHVDVPDPKGNRIIFYMVKNDKDEWKLSEKLPAWIQEAETALSEAIKDETQKNSLKRRFM
jgi:hypothetical protein